MYLAGTVYLCSWHFSYLDTKFPSLCSGSGTGKGGPIESRHTDEIVSFPVEDIKYCPDRKSDLVKLIMTVAHECRWELSVYKGFSWPQDSNEQVLRAHTEAWLDGHHREKYGHPDHEQYGLWSYQHRLCCFARSLSSCDTTTCSFSFSVSFTFFERAVWSPRSARWHLIVDTLMITKHWIVQLDSK